MKGDFLFFLEEKHKKNTRKTSNIEYIIITLLIIICIWAGIDTKPVTTELVTEQKSVK